MEIKCNKIKRLIHLYSKGDLDKVEELKELMERKLYDGHHKKFMRILNNYSQPSLNEAAFMAYVLETSIEALFEFEYPLG